MVGLKTPHYNTPALPIGPNLTLTIAGGNPVIASVIGLTKLNERPVFHLRNL
ncbi:hypothetical protein [Rubinisphaera sp.]|uniref:hypothetical protein n=1 Tax=Rubinisphaera sp. TaxID=2024857 RepID=UPI0025F5D641|nr:hypothetical protein [Rubinisphaera sp.]